MTHTFLCICIILMDDYVRTCACRYVLLLKQHQKSVVLCGFFVNNFWRLLLLLYHQRCFHYFFVIGFFRRIRKVEYQLEGKENKVLHYPPRPHPKKKTVSDGVREGHDHEGNESRKRVCRVFPLHFRERLRHERPHNHQSTPSGVRRDVRQDRRKEDRNKKIQSDKA